MTRASLVSAVTCCALLVLAGCKGGGDEPADPGAEADGVETAATGQNLRGVDWSGQPHVRVALPHADLRGARLDGTDLTQADLRQANLAGADGPGVKLERANLAGADLRAAQLSGALLAGADLRDARLAQCDLSKADFRGADLRGADLAGAILYYTVFDGADLRDANLTGGVFRYCSLKAADLRGARGLGPDSFEPFTRDDVTGATFCRDAAPPSAGIYGEPRRVDCEPAKVAPEAAGPPR